MMKNKTIELQELIRFISDDIKKVFGNVEDQFVDNIADAANVNETTLDWINPTKRNKQEMAEASIAKVMLVDGSIDYSPELQAQKKVLLVVSDPKMQLAKIGNHFFVDNVTPMIDATATINPSAEIGKDVYIGPYTVIGKCVIGEGCVIDSNVRIHDNVILGTGCVIKSGAVLGGEGFGYEKDENGNLFRFPQIGGLIIGNNVEVGSNTTIDRGALSDTVIGEYTKINNLCHIAHNNKIGRNVVITGCVNIAGSNTIEDNVWIAPNSSIKGWLHIGEGATVGMGSVVTKNIPAGETWVGNPARKLEKK